MRNRRLFATFERQFKVIVAEDATASFDEEFRKFSLKLFEKKYGRVLSVDEIVSELKK
ncbi:MAG: cysteine hydrolase [Desulfobacterales bacterium]|nr:cysteine hydrolase [Desulfobacterales bacterium]